MDKVKQWQDETVKVKYLALARASATGALTML
jgi:hypothetical protein